MAIIIGLTGGIATGKSTLTQLFIEKNIPVLDADQIAREVCKVNKPAYTKIVEFFGKEIVMESGELNRKKLGEIVFNDEEKLTLLNNIIHPEVKRVILREIKSLFALKHKFIVLDVPLLFESQFDQLCDLTLVVYTDESTQIERLMNRDHLSKEEALKRIKAQMDIRKKIELADVTIDNSNSLAETKKQFNAFLRKLKSNKDGDF